MRDGTSQEDRIMPALKEGYINVDEMSFEDLLAMAADYARILKFYDFDSKGIRPSGDWEPLFVYDEAVIMAMILATDLSKIESDFFRFLTEMGRGDYDLNDIPNYYLARKINSWYSQLKTSVSVTGRNLGDKIEDVIEEKLRKELHFLGSFLSKYEVEEEKFKQGFNSIWFSEEPVVAPSDGRDFLKSNFYSFYNAILYLKNSAETLLPDSLKSRTHNPAIALYIAFIKLFQKAQSKINRFTQRHLEFYYNDILKVKPREGTPGSTYLILHPDVEDREILAGKGTEFIAGIDENNQDVIYTADDNLLVNSAEVGSLYTLYFEHDPLDSPETELGFASGARVNQIPLIENDSGEGKELKAWSLFGAPKSEADQRLFKDAEIGFAIASPVLFLKEGQRDINFRFGYLVPEEEHPDSVLGKLATILDTSKKDAFFKAFRQMFTIYFTTEDGWFEVPEYVPSSRMVDDSYEKDCLVIQIRLSPDTEPVVPYSQEIHGGHYDTELPLVRFVINPRSYLYPYSLLKSIIVKEIEIDVDVKGIREALLYNNLGQLDPNTPFNPFGPVPTIGSYFVVGNPEAARKHITQFEVDVEWGDLPIERGGFEEYYQAYEMPFDNSVFEASVTVLRDGRWLPYEEDAQKKVKLFKSEDNGKQREGKYSIKEKCLSLGEDVTSFLRPIEGTTADEEFVYNALAKDGFLKFALTSPKYAFGHKAYPLKLTEALSANAKIKLLRPFKQVPNPPYTPLINVISINYKAFTTINLERMTSSEQSLSGDRIFYIHPFGSESISPATHREINLLPQYDFPANLFIGLSAPKSPGRITLFFYMCEDSTQETDAEPPEFRWYYLSSNEWKKLEEYRMVSDTTSGFLSSGIVTLDIPEDINQDNTIMPGELYWLRVSVDKRAETLCSVYSVHTQALKVSRHYREGSYVPPGSRLPAGTIKETRIPLPGIGAINQIVDSFDGRPTESEENLRKRMRERLQHKNRATTVWDYERLILDRFPGIYKVKCFSNMVAELEKEKRLRPGKILIVVIPYLKEQPSMNLKPLANALLLREVKKFAKSLASPFAEIEVRNPAYEQIQVRCTVKFRFSKGISTGYYINALNQAITDYLSPWNETGYVARFGWCIRQDDIESYIRNLEYIDFATNFSMLRIADKGEDLYDLLDTVKEPEEQAADRQLEEIRPLFPWSIAIPVGRHFIEMTDRTEPIPPEITGVDELEVGRTFIIS